jgi:hypothetical protein
MFDSNSRGPCICSRVCYAHTFVVSPTFISRWRGLSIIKDILGIPQILQVKCRMMTYNSHRAVGWSVNACDFFSRCDRFEPGHRLTWLRFYVIFLSHCRQIRGQCLNLGHDSFLSHPLQFIFHHYPVVQQYMSVVCIIEGFVKWTTGKYIRNDDVRLLQRLPRFIIPVYVV